MMIYPNQIKTSKEILDKFNQGHHWIILTAQPQSGKTGVCKSLCKLLSSYEKWFLCGMNDKNLKNQQINEFNNLIPNSNILFSKDMQKALFRHNLKYSKIINEEKVDNNGTYPKCVINKKSALVSKTILKETYKNSSKPKIIIKKSNTLKSEVILKDKSKIIIKKKVSHKLIILDESHYAQNAFSLVHQFIKFIMGITMDGDINKWETDNIYFLSVSATPMSELANLLDPTNKSNKIMINLKPSDNYYSFEKMIQSNKIYNAFDLNQTDECDQLIDVLNDLHEEQLSNNMFKYAIIRFCNNKRGRITQQYFKSNISYKSIIFHCKHNKFKDINKIVNKIPDEMTIIIIYHSLRAGIQLNTDNICLVHDMYNARVDVTAQGLAGRCCGYDKEKNKVEVFCHLERIKKYIELVNHQFDPLYIPSKCKNIDNGADMIHNKKFIASIPLAYKLNDDLLNRLHDYKDKHPNRYPDFENIFIDDLATYFIDYYDYMLVGVTILNENNETQSKTNTWIKFWNPAYSAYLNKKKGAFFRNCDLDPNLDHFMYIYINLDKNHDTYGWIIFTTQSRINTETLTNLIKTTGKEEFNSINN